MRMEMQDEAIGLLHANDGMHDSHVVDTNSLLGTNIIDPVLP